MSFRARAMAQGLSESELKKEYDRWRSKLELEYRSGKIKQHIYRKECDGLKAEYLEALRDLQAGAAGWVVPVPPAQPYPAAMTPSQAAHAAYQQQLNHHFRSLMIRLPADFTVQRNEPLPVEQSFGEITAFRVWRIHQVTGLLTSSFVSDYIWKPAEIMKSHKLPLDKDPEDQPGNERTGIHGWKSVIEVVEYGRGILAHEQSFSSGNLQVAGIVVGRVKLWGEVVEHQRGYRAEFCRIISIDDCWSQEHGMNWCDSPKFDAAELERLQLTYFPRQGQTPPTFIPRILQIKPPRNI